MFEKLLHREKKKMKKKFHRDSTEYNVYDLTYKIHSKGRVLILSASIVYR